LPVFLLPFFNDLLFANAAVITIFSCPLPPLAHAAQTGCFARLMAGLFFMSTIPVDFITITVWIRDLPLHLLLLIVVLISVRRLSIAKLLPIPGTNWN
jgi:hypothetical protein